ncbi:aspartate/glutamate racemase family protein [Candidatus Saccharibacteria bacterium]|nr:aspartate/glutamate racemase family protein [Candidatus Saccharibacteria bacterium]
MPTESPASTSPTAATSPLVHIGDCVAEKCQAANVRNVALLGTKFTMTEPFMKQRLEQNGLTVINDLPAEAVNEINRIIFGELCHDKLTQESQNYLHSLCTHLAAHKLKDNIDGIILGCTELQMALDNTFEIYLYSNYGVKLFDTTQAHIDKLVDLCLLSD